MGQNFKVKLSENKMAMYCTFKTHPIKSQIQPSTLHTLFRKPLIIKTYSNWQCWFFIPQKTPNNFKMETFLTNDWPGNKIMHILDYKLTSQDTQKCSSEHLPNLELRYSNSNWITSLHEESLTWKQILRNLTCNRPESSERYAWKVLRSFTSLNNKRLMKGAHSTSIFHDLLNINILMNITVNTCCRKQFTNLTHWTVTLREILEGVNINKKYDVENIFDSLIMINQALALSRDTIEKWTGSGPCFLWWPAKRFHKWNVSTHSEAKCHSNKQVKTA